MASARAVGVITDFNFPVAVVLERLYRGGAAIRWCEAFPEARFAPRRLAPVRSSCGGNGVSGYFLLLLAGKSGLLDRFVRDGVPLISFTGSGRGLQVDESRGTAGGSLLELSGNNAVIVDETADLDLAARPFCSALWVRPGSVAQHSAADRLSVHDELVDRLVKAYARVRVGIPGSLTTWAS